MITQTLQAPAETIPGEPGHPVALPLLLSSLCLLWVCSRTRLAQ